MAGSNATKQPRKSRRLRRSKRLSNTPNPSDSAIAYNGPIFETTRDTTTAILVDDSAITSAAMTGLISNTFNNNPSNARNWTEYSTSWGEYRVLGIKFVFIPLSTTSSANCVTFIGYNSVYHGTVVAPASLAQAASTGVARTWNGFRKFVREWRMVTPNEALFNPTSGPASTSDALVLYGNMDATSAGNTIGHLMIEYLVQFKAHRL